MIKSVYGVDDPDAYAKTQLRTRKKPPVASETPEMPDSVRFVHRHMQMADKADYASDSKMPDMIWG